jgi:hypothetical protein
MIMEMSQGRSPDPASYAEAYSVFLADSAALRLEVGRLSGQRQAIRDLHVPMTSGNTVICTGCSLDGGQAPWPCPTWKITETT